MWKFKFSLWSFIYSCALKDPLCALLLLAGMLLCPMGCIFNNVSSVVKTDRILCLVGLYACLHHSFCFLILSYLPEMLQIFNKSLLAKFCWAMDVDPDFRF